MKKFLRTLLVLTLAIALVFTMSVPAFAGTNYQYVDVKNHENYHTTDSDLSYLPLGDSIAAGVTSTSKYRNEADLEVLKTSNTNAYNYYSQFYDYWYPVQIKDDDKQFKSPAEKNGDVYAIDFAFVSEIADRIKANKDKSYNGAFTGLRSKDICNLLDICDPAEGDSYSLDKDYWPMSADFYGLFWGDLKSKNAENYLNAIKVADVITVELGQNDMLSSILAFIQADPTKLEKLLGIFDLMGEDTDTIKNIVDNCVKLVQDPQNMLTYLKNLKDELGDLYATVSPVLSVLVEYSEELNYKSEYYFTNMMKFIRETNEKDAIIVVGTVINPFANEEGQMKTIGQIMDLLYFNKINSVIKENALKYEYHIADLSFVNMTPTAGATAFRAANTSETDIPIAYNYHPTYDDQMEIANAYVKKIEFAQNNPNYFVKERLKGVAKVAVAGAVTGAVISNVSSKVDKVVEKYKENTAETEKAPVTEQPTEVKEEPVTETVENPIMTEEVTALVSDATLRCTTEKTSKGIKVTAKVADADLDALTEDGYQVTYKFYRSTKAKSGYKYMLTSKKGTYTNTSVKKGNKYYYKTVLIVTDSEGNEVTKSVLKDCKYGARTF